MLTLRRSTRVQGAASFKNPKTPTVDASEVDYHAKFSDYWWDLNGPIRGLHRLNPIRIQFIKKGLANVGFRETNPLLPLEGIKILDVGCGAGILSESLARAGAITTGLDPSVDLIEVAKQHAALDPNLSDSINYVASTIEELSESNPESFDAVVASEVIEHITDKDSFIKYCVKAVKPGGSVFVTTPNKTLLSWIGGIVMAEYLVNFIPRGTHSWNKFISLEDTKKILEKYGCGTVLVQGTVWNIFKDEWQWMASTQFCYALHAVKDKRRERKTVHET